MVTVADVAGFGIAAFALGPRAPKGEFKEACAQTVEGIAGAEIEADLVNCVNWHQSGNQLEIWLSNIGGEALTDFKVYQHIESALAIATGLTTKKVDITAKFTRYHDDDDPTTLGAGESVILSHGRGDLPDGFKLAFKATTDADITYIVRMA